MTKVAKHKRRKRATVLIKRTRCIRNIKPKPVTPLYQKLKFNNHSLAKALSQERQEYQLLFSKNNELLGDVQDLVHACNKRELVISNILKNSKEMLQMLVTMSGYLTNVISSCQEFVSNQANTHRTSSSSSAGRRDSIRRVSTKSPARGVVKPMVSGHTITKPTINLSRINMQRIQNTNLSIIDEGSTTPERSLDRSVRSRSLSERLPVSSLRNEGDEERIIINRRTSRYSGNRLSSGRYSKRNSGRLSGGAAGGVAGRLSKRISDSFELTKSPRVTLQDVSRLLSNNQTVNVRLLAETSNVQSSDQSISSPENVRKQNKTSQSSEQDSCSDTTDSESDCAFSSKKSTAKNDTKRSVHFHLSNNSSRSSTHGEDPLEGPSWLYDENSMEENDSANENNCNVSRVELEPPQSPVSSLPADRRRSSGGNFRVPELPKRFAKPTNPKLNLTDYFDSPGSTTSPCNTNGLQTSSRPIENETDENDDDNDDENRRMNLCFITNRRGPVLSQDLDDDDDETIMLNIRRQLTTQQPSSQQQHQTPEPSERMQFDINELLQTTPLKSLLTISCAPNNVFTQPEPESEPTAQLTQTCAQRPEETVTLSRVSTMRIHPSVTRGQEITSGINIINQESRRMSQLSTVRLSSSRIELPRLTELHNISGLCHDESNGQSSQRLPTPDKTRGSKREKRKRTVPKHSEYRTSASDTEEETSKQPKKKPGRKKKSNNKDPSSAKVVLQKLNDSQRLSSINESAKSERKNSDEYTPSTSSVTSRVDPLSDSEGSTTSLNSRQMSMRPRRQKAPKNLQESSLKMKLRR